MPPRRAAAAKASQATSSQINPPAAAPAAKKAPAKKPASKKRAASPVPADDDDDDAAKDDDDDDKPKKKRAKTSKSTDDDVVAPPPKVAKVIRRGTAVPVDNASGYIRKPFLLRILLLSSKRSLLHVFKIRTKCWFKGMRPTTLCSTKRTSRTTATSEVLVKSQHRPPTDSGISRFYVLQLLHRNGDSSSCTLFTRWGRVGEEGKTQTKARILPHHAAQRGTKPPVVWSRH